MIDLKQLMEERSAPQPTLDDLRYSQVRRRITTRNRRRIALLATTVAVILAIAGGYAALPHQRVSPDPLATPPTTVNPSTGFAPYQFGRKMVQYASAPTSSGALTLTWTPDKLEFHFSLLCSGQPENVYIRGSMLVNGNLEQEYSCGERGGDQVARTEDWARSGWVRPGEPITLSFTVEEATTFGGGRESMESPAAMPRNGTIAVAIYAPVPFEEYQFPPRPAQLPPLADWTDCPLDHHVRRDASDPLRPASVTMPWKGDIVFRWDTQTPGLLHIAVDGVKIATVGWWEYGHLNWSRLFNTANEPEWAGIPGWKFPAQGAEVTITFTPEHFTGAWQAGLRHMETDLDYGPCR